MVVPAPKLLVVNVPVLVPVYSNTVYVCPETGADTEYIIVPPKLTFPLTTNLLLPLPEEANFM